MKKVKVLFIGLGGVGQRHMRNLIDLDMELNFDIYAYRRKNKLFEISNELEISNENIVEKYSITTFNNLDEALGINPELTFICNPSSFHIDPAIKALQSGSHVFIEKPLSNSLKGIEKLNGIAIKNKKIVYVGFQLRFNPVLNKLKDILSKDIIGKLTSVRAEVCEFMPNFHKYEDYRDSYAAKEELGGGVILTQIHELDYLSWIFGNPSKLVAYGNHSSDLEIDVEDNATILMESIYNDNILPISLYMDYLQKPPRRSCIVFGTEGCIEASLKDLTLKVYSDDHLTNEYSWDGFERNQQFVDQTENFVNAALNNKPPMVTLDQGINSLKTAIKIKESILDNQSKIL